MIPCKLYLTKFQHFIGVENVNESDLSGGNEETVGIWDLFRREEYRLPIFITISMHLSQQLSGIVGIFYYSTRNPIHKNKVRT